MYEAAIGSITVIVLEKSYEAEICGLYICLWAIYIVDESTQRWSNKIYSYYVSMREVVVLLYIRSVVLAEHEEESNKEKRGLEPGQALHSSGFPDNKRN